MGTDAPRGPPVGRRKFQTQDSLPWWRVSVLSGFGGGEVVHCLVGLPVVLTVEDGTSFLLGILTSRPSTHLEFNLVKKVLRAWLST